MSSVVKVRTARLIVAIRIGIWLTGVEGENGALHGTAFLRGTVKGSECPVKVGRTGTLMRGQRAAGSERLSAHPLCG